MARPTSDWASAGRVVGAVAGHRHEVAVRLLRPDEGDLVLGLGLGDEVVDACLARDGRRGARVVAGDHHGPDAHPAELGEALDEALLDRVLELDQRRGPGRRVRTASGVAPRSAMASVSARSSGGIAPSRSAAMASTAPLRIRSPSVGADAARAGLGAERDLLGDPARQLLEAGVVGGPSRAAELRSRSRASVDDRSGPSGVSSRIDATSAALQHLVLRRRRAPATIDDARRLP